MNILAIECTHAALSVAVKQDGAVTELKSADWRKAAEALVPLIDDLIRQSGLEKQELDYIAISSGPGSFTSLRIGMSVAKGMAYGLGIPLIPVPTMPAMASSFLTGGSRVMAVIQARKGEYYFATYLSEELSTGVWHDEILRGSTSEVAAAAQGYAVVGRQLDELNPLLACSGAAYTEADFFSASSLFPLAEKLFAAAVALDQVVPDYRQMFIPNVGKE
jgi:tRNA threonylcarbamoyladenosine biosynthesis protein TsaB